MSGFFKRLTGKKQEVAYSGSARDHIGWLWDEPSSTYLNVTPRFEEFIGRQVDNTFKLPEDANRYTYLLVPGLFTNKYPGYMEAPLNKLKKAGLDVRKVMVDTGGSVEKNAALIKFEIDHATAGKKIVLIGHSKGAVDAAAAIALNPYLLPYIRCFIAVQAPYGGSPIPQDILGSSGFLNAVLETVKVFDPDAMKDMAYLRRREFVLAHPFPSDLLPTLSFGCFTTKASLMCSSTQKHMQEKYGALSDGLVPLRDAFIPGSAIVILEGADHGSPVFSMGDHKQYKPGRIFMALIAIACKALEMPPNVSKLCKRPIDPIVDDSGPEPRQGEAWLYDGINYCTEPLKVRAACENLADYCMNNKISSIRVGPGTVLEVFDNVYFAGQVYFIDRDQPLLEPHLNDKISSLRVVVPSLRPPPSAAPAPFNWNNVSATLDIAHTITEPGPTPQEIWGYQQPHYAGSPLGYRGEMPTIPEMIASIRLGPGMAATTFPEPNFGGLTYQILGDHPTLPLRIVSMRVQTRHTLHGAASVVAVGHMYNQSPPGSPVPGNPTMPPQSPTPYTQP